MNREGRLEGDGLWDQQEIRTGREFRLKQVLCLSTNDETQGLVLKKQKGRRSEGSLPGFLASVQLHGGDCDHDLLKKLVVKKAIRDPQTRRTLLIIGRLYVVDYNKLVLHYLRMEYNKGFFT